MKKPSLALLFSDVPGKIGAPNATDIGKTWVSLSWARPEQSGGAPVTAYKVESWILGEEARWTDVSLNPYCFSFKFLLSRLIFEHVQYEFSNAYTKF